MRGEEGKIPGSRSEFDIVVSKKLYSWDNKPIALVYSVKPSAAISEMSQMNESQFVRATIFLLLVVLVMVLFLYYFVNRPLGSISKSLKTSNPKLVEGFSKKKDEFGEIAGLIIKSFQQRDSLSMEIEERKKAGKEVQDSFLKTIRHQCLFTSLTR